jgi:hypothetical protein
MSRRPAIGAIRSYHPILESFPPPQHGFCRLGMGTSSPGADPRESRAELELPRARRVPPGCGGPARGRGRLRQNRGAVAQVQGPSGQSSHPSVRIRLDGAFEGGECVPTRNAACRPDTRSLRWRRSDGPRDAAGGKGQPTSESCADSRSPVPERLTRVRRTHRDCGRAALRYRMISIRCPATGRPCRSGPAPAGGGVLPVQAPGLGPPARSASVCPRGQSRAASRAACAAEVATARPRPASPPSGCAGPSACERPQTAR